MITITLRSGPVPDQSQTSRHHSAVEDHCGLLRTAAFWSSARTVELAGTKRSINLISDAVGRSWSTTMAGTHGRPPSVRSSRQLRAHWHSPAFELPSTLFQFNGRLLVTRDHTVLFRSNRQSRVMHRCVDVEIWSRSRVTRAFVEPPECDMAPKSGLRTPKRRIFGNFLVRMSKISGGGRHAKFWPV
jgi:hypothetical protein